MDKHPSYNHFAAVGAFSHKFSIVPSGKTTDRIKKVRGSKNGTVLLYHHAKYGGDPGSRAGCRRKSVMFFTGRPARSGAMPVLFLLSGSKMGFSPRSGALEALRDALYKYTTTTIDTTTTTTTRCPNKREIWYPCQISRLSGQKCGNTAPKTVKISNFGHKFVPRGRLVCNIVR